MPEPRTSPSGPGRWSPVDVIVLLGALVNVAVIGAIVALWAYSAL